ncbi:PepSY domain-containing protein [Kocuria sp. cx-455]|uniref:PepSY domain-containing protein n=1 Tax=Kocuria sp. cx-455 TaxID=2771377 RepID=UPI0016841E31|nr:PepSY domain-containing protein [Kocuria sp. cx-455]MBD2766109.1 PepSY domain-containing protein [Kocuria sp. cx-455]
MKHTEKILTLSSSAVIGALLLTGCGGSNDEPAAEAPAETTAAVPENESTAEITDDPSDGEASAASESPSASAAAGDQNGGQAASLAAVDTLLAKYEGGDVVELDYDRDNGTFEADVIQNDTKHEVTLDGAGENITNEQEDGTADQDDLDELGRASISIKEAVESAFGEVSSQGGTVLLDDVSLDDDNDTLNWEVELDIDDSDATYYVDANSGSVSSNN